MPNKRYIFTIPPKPLNMISIPPAPREIANDGVVHRPARNGSGDGPLIFAIPGEIQQ
uniref:Unkown protein n=1 Tax=Riptortus pedestris TaxID=329032 RepID=R4WU25_RIPPE|nr:unkown protein [Riptortus pedestris]